MKVLFINPHRSDFVYNSPAYSIIKRKSLRKYKYLDKFFNEHDTDFLFCKSSFNRILTWLNIRVLDFLFLKIESKIFTNINVTNNFRILFSCNQKYDVTFCFGFAIRDLKINEFDKIFEKSNLVIIHLSHYHLFANKLNEWSLHKNVIFCADSDITDNYFYNYHLKNTPPFFLLSFSIDIDRFKFYKPFEYRTNKILSTGTFHEFEKIYKYSYLKKNSISNIFGFLTIHPERRMLFYLQHLLDKIVIYNSSMGGFNLFKKNNNINQKKYFSFDIVEKYNEYNYVFVGEESITGLPGIGVFEAILCGCRPIINDYCYKGTPLEKSKIPIIYNNMNNLFNIIKNFDSTLYSKPNILDDIHDLRNDISIFYSEENQINLLKQFLNI